MFLTKLKYAVRDSIRSITRHKVLSILTVLTIAITLTVLSMTSLIALNSYNASQSVEDQLRIIAFLKQPSNSSQVGELEKNLKNMKHVADVQYISKEDALKSLDNEFKNTDMDLKQSLEGNNPLPDSFQLTVDQAENIETVANELSKHPSVDTVKYGQDIVHNVLKFNHSATIVGGIIVVTMILATLFLINITIQLTVANRHAEIQIMKLVGAKNNFIRFPFFLEGMILGLLGSLIAGVFVFWGYERIYAYIYANIPFLPLFNNDYMMEFLIFSNVLLGIVLGAIGSILAVRKHLKI